MSISDEIVLMDFGEEQQMGEPQDVYDKPDNLFVAKFLGTPPINIFDGEIKGKKILINNIDIGKTKASDQEIVVGIRPEGFIVDEKGVLELEVYQVETIGRDTTLIIKDPTDNSGEKTFRAIVDAQYRIKPGDIVNLNVKEYKTFIFNKETGENL